MRCHGSLLEDSVSSKRGLLGLGNTKGTCSLLFSPQYCQVLMWRLATTSGNSLKIKPIHWIWDCRKRKNISDDGMVLTRSLNNKLSNVNILELLIICDSGCCHCLNHFNLYFLLHADECLLFKYLSNVPNCFCAGMYSSHTICHISSVCLYRFFLYPSPCFFFNNNMNYPEETLFKIQSWKKSL